MTPQQQALIQKAARSIQSAIGQNETGFPEFAASRAYYAMFYIASAFIEGEGLAFSSHAAVIATFGQVESRGAIKLRPSLLDPDLPLSYHPAPDSIRQCLCSCVHNRGRIHVEPPDYYVSSCRDFHLYGAG